MSLKKAQTNIASVTKAQRGVLLQSLVGENDLDLIDFIMQCDVNQDDIEKAAASAAVASQAKILATILTHFPGTMAWRDGLLKTAIAAGSPITAFVLTRPSRRLMTSLQCRENGLKSYLSGSVSPAVAAVLADSDVSSRLREKTQHNLAVASGDADVYTELLKSISRGGLETLIHRQRRRISADFDRRATLGNKVIAENPTYLTWSTLLNCGAMTRRIPKIFLKLDDSFAQRIMFDLMIQHGFSQSLRQLTDLQAILDRPDAAKAVAKPAR